MPLHGRHRALISVVLPVYQVEAWLDECLQSLVDQSHRRWHAVLVDDGSTDSSAAIADAWARRDRRIRVVRTENRGLGAARNEGLRHAHGEFLAFLDSDDVLPPDAYAAMVAALRSSGADFVTGSIARREGGQDVEPAWMRRLHQPPLTAATIGERPEILGDVFAWNKLFRRAFWTDAALAWPEGLRYEDQPTTTAAYLSGRFDVIPDLVYAWRIREDGTSITQDRGSVTDVRDRFVSKCLTRETVRNHGDPTVTRTLESRVLVGDLWRYFVLIPETSLDWWRELRRGLLSIWDRRTYLQAELAPVHRLCGWLVLADRRSEAIALMQHFAQRGGRLERRRDATTGAIVIDLPEGVVDLDSVPPEALTRDSR